MRRAHIRLWSPMGCRSTTACLALACALSSTAGSAQTLLGLCSTSSSAECVTSTAWSVAESAAPSLLNNPNESPATFDIVVTEGASSRALELDDTLTLDGLLQSGTEVTAIFLSVQKADGSGGYTTVGSAVVGDPSNACGCPYVASSMTLTAQDGSGNTLAGNPLLSLAFADEQLISLSASWDMGSGLINPGDSLRLQPCIAFRQAAISLPFGCYASGGSIHSVRACSAIALDACPAQPATLTETLSSLSNNTATLGAFTASTSSPSLSPPSVSQTPGGAAVSFTATASGVVGTQSTVVVSGQVSCAGTGTSQFGDAAAISGASASASIQVECLGNGWSCTSLGPAAPYNVFLTQGIAASDSDIEGALAAAGDVTLTNYGVGKSLAGSSPLALVAGGNLNLSSAWIFGDAWVGGTSSLALSGETGVLHQGSPINFAAAAAQLSALSSQLAALPALGTVTISDAAGAVLTGADPNLDVFQMTADQLDSAWGVTVTVPPSAFAVINITGAQDRFYDQALSLGSLLPQQLIINLPQATALQLYGVGMEGTVLAPQAAVQFDNGTALGAIVASSLSGTGQTNLTQAVGCIPIPVSNGGGAGGGSGGSGGGSGGSCSGLGAAAPYNVFVSGAYTGSSSDVEGAIAAGGAITLSSYTVGESLAGTPGALALVAGGDLSFTTGGNVYGNVAVGGTASIANQVTVSGEVEHGTPVQFAPVFAALDSLSQQLAGESANGSWAALYGNITLSGSDPNLNVFNLPASALDGQWGITLSVPSSSFALVNLNGPSATLQHTIQLNGLPSSNLLFNLPLATAVTIQDTQLTASVLAPGAAITFNSGVVQGTLIGSSFTGGGQTNLAPLNSCVPDPSH